MVSRINCLADKHPQRCAVFQQNFCQHRRAIGLIQSVEIVIICAFFMATDYTTSPVTGAGQAIMGFGVGLIIFIIRTFGAYPEGVTYALMFMNILTPLIDRFVRPKVYGEVKQHG